MSNIAKYPIYFHESVVQNMENMIDILKYEFSPDAIYKKKQTIGI